MQANTVEVCRGADFGAAKGGLVWVPYAKNFCRARTFKCTEVCTMYICLLSHWLQYFSVVTTPIMLAVVSAGIAATEMAPSALRVYKL